MLGGRTAVLLVAAAAALCAWPVAGAGAGSDVARARTVQIVFTGKGGGRYLDHTRWLHEVTRQCYASRLADETLSVRWRIEWTARLVPGAKGYVLRAPARRNDAIAGSVDGYRRPGQLRLGRGGARLGRDVRCARATSICTPTVISR